MVTNDKNIRCHLGQTILYDTVSKFNWAVDLRTHSIIKVIEYVLANDWEPPSEGKAGRQVPEITHEDDCVVRSLLSAYV